jgi:hypothetical protein
LRIRYAHTRANIFSGSGRIPGFRIAPSIAGRQARRLNPQLTIKWMADHYAGLPPTGIVDGLRKAGLPEE